LQEVLNTDFAAPKRQEKNACFLEMEKEEEYVGFIAEDVPDLVANRDRETLSSMDIVAVLTKVVQSQQATIARLQEEVNEWKRQAR